MSDETYSAVAQIERIERTVTVQGIETHLFEAGPPTAEPLIYLHGTFMGNLWLEHHAALSQHFHVFAPDMPGFGLTQRPDWLRDVSDYTLYFRDLFKALNLDQALLVGYSLGGWMAAEIAVWFPERVKKLVLSNAAGIRVKGSPIADIFAMNAQEFLAATFEDFAAAAPLMPASFDVDYLMDQYRQRVTLAALAWNPSFDPKLERRLSLVTCPTLIIWGVNDRIVPLPYADAFKKAIPHAEVVKLEGTGHVPILEKAEEWDNAVIEFLRKA